MIIEGATLDAVKEVAEGLGIRIVEQQASRPKGSDEVKVLIRPMVGSMRFRAMTTTGHTKPSLCLHGQYAFMSRLLARFPGAVLRTWVNTWNYPLFQGGAKAWTQNEERERGSYQTCDCDPDTVDDAMQTPDELRAKGGPA